MAKRSISTTTSRLTRVNYNKPHTDEDFDCSDRVPSTRASRQRKSKKRKLIQHDGPDDYEAVSSPSEKRQMGTYPHPISSHVIQSPGLIRVALLRWFAGVYTSRAMPWRKHYDSQKGPYERGQRAYEVWVSEIMLQQTQVSTVIPYYNRWMERFPTIRDLAAANIDEVNALWKGLGYYSRASRLLSGAQKVVAQYEGKLPENAKDLEANIPGIGRYSAGAIASIAYGENVPVLDGNVHRLMSRLLAVYAPPKSKATLDILWAAAAAMVEDNNENIGANIGDSPKRSSFEFTQYPGDINQALIELGSTVCKVRDPTCELCPLRPWCRAYEVSQPSYNPISDIEDACTLCHPLQETSVVAYPMKAERKKPREELDIVNVIEWRALSEPSERWFLMIRRPEGGLLAGLYEFPTSSDVAKSTSRTVQNKIPQALLSNLLGPSILPYNTKGSTNISATSLRINSIKPIGDVVHVFSHIKKTYRSQWVILQGGETPPTLRVNSTKTMASSVSHLIDDDDGGSPSPLRTADAMWVRLADVPGINMGTGVVKVWNSIKKLWEGEVDGS